MPKSAAPSSHHTVMALPFRYIVETFFICYYFDFNKKKNVSRFDCAYVVFVCGGGGGGGDSAHEHIPLGEESREKSLHA